MKMRFGLGQGGLPIVALCLAICNGCLAATVTYPPVVSLDATLRDFNMKMVRFFTAAAVVHHVL